MQLLVAQASSDREKNQEDKTQDAQSILFLVLAAAYINTFIFQIQLCITISPSVHLWTSNDLSSCMINIDYPAFYALKFHTNIPTGQSYPKSL
jgi:hypothetical protein